MAYKVVFVTSAQPSANPRMLKSALTLSELGYDVTVIYARISSWANEFDSQLFESNNRIKWIGVGLLNKKSIFSYYFRVRQNLWKLFEHLTSCRFLWTARGFTMYSQELEKMALQFKADLYIGHNLGALRAIVLAAKKFNSISIFDFEDYHSGEQHQERIAYQLVKKYESVYVPRVNYLTASSYLITELYKSTFQNIRIQTVLNVFSVKNAVDQIRPYSNAPLKLFWFSQFVGLERGLQSVLKAMSCFDKGEIQLTIVGNCNDEVKEYFLKLISDLQLSESEIKFNGVVSEIELFRIMQTHHVGIAAEVVNVLNREVCLTNKIFCYMLGGLALAVSNTKAQIELLKANKKIGFVFDTNDEQTLVEGLRNYIQYPSLLQHDRENSLLVAKETYNWEVQSLSWSSLIKEVLLP